MGDFGPDWRNSGMGGGMGMSEPDPMDVEVLLKEGSDEWQQWIEHVTRQAMANPSAMTRDFTPKPGGFFYGTNSAPIDSYDTSSMSSIFEEAGGGGGLGWGNQATAANYVLMAFPTNPRHVYETTDGNGVRPDAMDAPPVGL